MKRYRKTATVAAYQHLSPEPLHIETKTGVQTARFGDWVIVNPDGEQYPCPQHIFETTYEEAK